MQFKSIGVVVALCVLSAGAAQAKVVHFAATLSGSQQVPAVTTGGTGQVSATLDTDRKVFTFTATYSGLSGPVAAAHFHGPAAPGANAPPVVPVPPTDLASPISGTASLTDAQINDLTAGKWYFNVHTAAHPGGEIRGQLTIEP